MNPLTWGEEYNIGLVEIDEQHREFVNIINKIIRAETEKCPIEFGARLIFELLKYAEFHFVCEENLMYRNNYPGYNGQITEHRKLLAIMDTKMREFQSKVADYDSIAKFSFMWLISHTVEEDKKFGAFMQIKDKASQRPMNSLQTPRPGNSTPLATTRPPAP